MTLYRTIVADPPWLIDGFPNGWFGYGDRGVTQPMPYPPMTLDQIQALPVRELANLDCDLYLWTINDWLADAFSVVRAWGFQHSATLVWCKPRRGVGLGGKYPSDVEFILYATRRAPNPIREEEAYVAMRLRTAKLATGKTRREIDEHFGTENISAHWFTPDGFTVNTPTLEQWAWLRGWLRIDDAELDALIADLNDRKGERVAPPLERAPGRWFHWPVAEHSRKPEAFLDLVETVSRGPYCELFARRQRLGWDTWGDEALEHVDLESA